MSDDSTTTTDSDGDGDTDTTDARREPAPGGPKPTLKETIPAQVGPLEYKTYSLAYPYFAKPIVFNHKHFSRFPREDFVPQTRKGSSSDVQRLKEIFHLLNCDAPEIHKDVAVGDIKKTLSEVSRRNHDRYACIVVVVLTHGEENFLYAHDDKYETCKLWEPFIENDDPNSTLAGKPKLFFIQACRGDRLDISVDVVDAKGVLAEEPPLKKIPRCADFFVAHSSFFGYMSVRNERYGSWFIQTLCEAIDKYKTHLDLMQIMTIVKHDIAFHRAFRHEEKQIPCTETTLTKTLFLTKEAFRSTLGDPMASSNRDTTDSGGPTPCDVARPPVAQSIPAPHTVLCFGDATSKGLFLAVVGLLLLHLLVVAFTNGTVQYDCHCQLPSLPPSTLKQYRS